MDAMGAGAEVDQLRHRPAPALQPLRRLLQQGPHGPLDRLRRHGTEAAPHVVDGEGRPLPRIRPRANGEGDWQGKRGRACPLQHGAAVEHSGSFVELGVRFRMMVPKG